MMVQFVCNCKHFSWTPIIKVLVVDRLIKFQSQLASLQDISKIIHVLLFFPVDSISLECNERNEPYFSTEISTFIKALMTFQ